ncbi:MAG: hypothetical protein MR868_01435 [Lachnospiraceae bacterium]|nr:hypothetical protein [Lachnospiraceae bacterium]
MLTIKPLPQNMSKLPVDFRHPNRALIQGCFREEVEVAGQTRNFISYLPENIEYCQRCIVVCPPSDENPLEFLEISGLKELADRQKLYIFLMEKEGSAWKTDGTDADFMNAVYVKIQARDYYVTMQDNIYALGIGDGAGIAQTAASRMSGDWSGLMSIGDLDAGFVQEGLPGMKEREQGNLELQVSAQKSQLPVWMVFSSMEGAQNKAVTEYWKEQNQVLDSVFSGEGADYIWMPTPVRMTDETNDEKVAQVRVTTGRSDAVPEMIETMWNYIGSLRRHRGQGSKNLRYFKDPAAYGAALHTIEVDGMSRIWYEYVPDSCTPDKTWPVVVTMHGRGGTAETFFDITGLANVAQQRRFIAVFPQAGIHQQKKDGLKNILLWNGFYDDKHVDDVKFIRVMIDDIKKRLPVDTERIYACGQSSGGMMTDMLCNHAGDIFAACASWSATENAVSQKTVMEESKDLVPYMLMYGDRDFLCASKEEVPGFPYRPLDGIRKDLEHKMEKYGCSRENVESWETYPIRWWCYKNAEQVPMLTVGVVNNMVHANFPEQSRISYDQFFAHFRKASDGTLYYRNKPVFESKGE